MVQLLSEIMSREWVDAQCVGGQCLEPSKHPSNNFTGPTYPCLDEPEATVSIPIRKCSPRGEAHPSNPKSQRSLPGVRRHL